MCAPARARYGSQRFVKRQDAKTAKAGSTHLVRIRLGVMASWRFAFLLNVAVGCARVPPPAITAPASAPPAAKPRSDAERAEAARLLAIETELAALRGRPFLKPVPYERQTRETFRAYVRAELARELGPAKAADHGRALVALGLAPEGFDLRASIEEALVTQVAAYYDTKTRAFHVLETTRPKDDAKWDAIIVAHELTHALQDQHFDLEAYHGEKAKVLDLDDDEDLARRFVVEGEATFLMFAHALGSGVGEEIRLGPFAVAGLRMTLAMLSAADLVEVLAMSHKGRAAKDLDADTRAELEAVARLPLYVTLTMNEPYFKGAELVSDAWASGGWPAVDGLFRHPPQSTEQALHPREKLLATRDAPVRVRLPAQPPPLPPAGGAPRLLETNVLGELGWRIYFKTWAVPAGDAAAAGWGGDRFWVWERGGRVVTLVATTWDDETEARDFVAAYEASLAARFPKGTVGASGGAGEGLLLRAPGGRELVVERHGRDVDVIDGARGEELASLRAALRAATREAAPPR